LETKDECLVFCLSFLEDGKALSRDSGWGRVAVGRATRADFARAVVRFLMGAYYLCLALITECIDYEGELTIT
jgi:hypothetical protein